MISIDINNYIDIKNLKDPNAIIERAVIETLKYFQLDNKNIEVNINVIDSEEIKILNNKYRNKNKTTDVLSFPMGLDLSFPHIILGDILINGDKVYSQAMDYGHSVERELTFLVVHSMLHLLGYDHIDESDRIEMRREEKEIMKILKVFK